MDNDDYMVKLAEELANSQKVVFAKAIECEEKRMEVMAAALLNQSDTNSEILSELRHHNMNVEKLLEKKLDQLISIVKKSLK